MYFNSCTENIVRKSDFINWKTTFMKRYVNSYWIESYSDFIIFLHFRLAEEIVNQDGDHSVIQCLEQVSFISSILIFIQTGCYLRRDAVEESHVPFCFVTEFCFKWTSLKKIAILAKTQIFCLSLDEKPPPVIWSF